MKREVLYVEQEADPKRGWLVTPTCEHLVWVKTKHRPLQELVDCPYCALLTRPRVGVGVFVFSERFFLLGKRKGSHGAGHWSLPGGHLEYGESFEKCCSREVTEETGLKIKDVSFLTATNDIFGVEELHYVTLFFEAKLDGEPLAEPTNMEPEKCEGWKWVDYYGSRPKPLFLPLEHILEMKHLFYFQKRGGA